MMDSFGAPESALIVLLLVGPLFAWAFGNTREVSEIPKEFQDELKKRMEERIKRTQNEKPNNLND